MVFSLYVSTLASPFSTQANRKLMWHGLKLVWPKIVFGGNFLFGSAAKSVICLMPTRRCFPVLFSVCIAHNANMWGTRLLILRYSIWLHGFDLDQVRLIMSVKHLNILKLGCLDLQRNITQVLLTFLFFKYKFQVVSLCLPTIFAKL